MKYEIFIRLAKEERLIYNEHRKSTHSKADAPEDGFIWPSVRAAHPVGRRGGHFYFRLFLLSRKASNAMSIPPKEISKPMTPRKTIMIS